MANYNADDLALAALLRIVPGGYRLVDAADERFLGVRDKFVRLAFRHLGPRPSLVGFTGPGQDPAEAAAGAAQWAAQNLRPSAIQRRVEPGVLVIALDPPPGAPVGRLPGLPVHTAVWTVAQGHARTPSRPPGAPSPRLLKQAVASLERGEPAPSIGTIDVAERALMSGGGHRRGFTWGSGAGLGAVILFFIVLRFLPGLVRGPGQAPQGQNGACSAAQGCLSLGPGSNGGTVRVAAGTTIVVRIPGLGGGQDGCLQDSGPQQLLFEQCTTTGGDPGEVLAVYRAVAPGSARLTRRGFGLTIIVA